MGRDGYTGFVILAASLGLIWATLGLERHPMVPVGPGFYPRIVLAITALMALALLVRDLLARRGAGRPPRSGEPPAHGLVAATFATFGAYLLALPWLGFRVATFLFLLAMPVILEPPRTRRRWIVVLVLAAVATAATYVVFERYLYVLLPRGRWTGF